MRLIQFWLNEGKGGELKQDRRDQEISVKKWSARDRTRLRETSRREGKERGEDCGIDKFNEA